VSEVIKKWPELRSVIDESVEEEAPDFGTWGENPFSMEDDEDILDRISGQK
jgi:hypothetical protein